MNAFNAEATYNAAASTFNKLRDRFNSDVTDKVVEKLAIKPGDRIIDVACGAGAVALRAAEKTGPTGNVVGVDISSNMIDFARKNLQKSNLGNVKFELGDMEHLDYEEDSFDAVSCCLAVFFSTNITNTISSLWRILRPGGRLVLATPSRNMLHPVSAVFLDLVEMSAPDLDVSLPWSTTERIAALRAIIDSTDIESSAVFDHEDAVVELSNPEEGWEFILGSGLRWVSMELGAQTLEDIHTKIIEWIEVNTIRSVVLGVNYTTVVKTHDAD